MNLPTLTDFLLARIADDRDRAAQMLTAMLEFDALGALADIGDLVSPSRLRAECDAKEAVVIMCGEHPEQPWDTEEADHLATRVLKMLAAPYADHVHFREEWRL